MLVMYVSNLVKDDCGALHLYVHSPAHYDIVSNMLCWCYTPKYERFNFKFHVLYDKKVNN